ncbi:MAG: ABC-F family ATP-binding cassette domain-containing protein [Bacteroidales bacterium]|nr:ABC-F family ATP-binding cassette domain-containing protein [Bacteroidales bacterium]
MLLMSCQNVSRGYDATPLFEEVAFELHAGERVGLVGPNGAGKTTLLKVLAGVDEPESGEVKLHAGARLGVLQQVAEFPPGRTLFQEAKSAFDELLETQNELHRVADQLAQCSDENERKALSARFDRLTEQLATNDAYQLDHRVADVLSGLGFRDSDYEREVRTFSGGQQRRLLLAKLLLSAPDVMLLDEPSNHLDIATTRWLEAYLARQPQGMIVVSHDRYFLDKVATEIFELHAQRISVYPGNFTKYIRLRDERYDRQLKDWQAQKEYIEKQEDYIRRNGYGQKARQAQSRMKALDKVEVLDRPTKVSGPNIRFNDVMRAGDIVFSFEDVTKAFGEKVLFQNLSFDLPRGKRLGIMGPNGSGKTTLLKMLLGEEPPTSGTVRRGHLVFPGYLDQHLKLLDDEASVVRAIWPEPDPSLNEQKMRDILGRFGLHGETVEQPVKSLSGGERSRAALAKLTMAGGNVLILDEPTNHLDLWACDSLEEAVREYEGTVIVVSHDRYFLNRVADLLIVIENGVAELVYGNYDTYELIRAARENDTKPQPEVKRDTASASVSASSASTTGKVKRKRKFPYRKAADVEADIAALEARIAALDAELLTAECYRDATRFQQTMAEVEAARQRLPELYEHWEEAAELNG